MGSCSAPPSGTTVLIEAAGAQCLLLAGFFEDQMRRRYNIRWYAELGATLLQAGGASRAGCAQGVAPDEARQPVRALAPAPRATEPRAARPGVPAVTARTATLVSGRVGPWLRASGRTGDPFRVTVSDRHVMRDQAPRSILASPTRRTSVVRAPSRDEKRARHSSTAHHRATRVSSVPTRPAALGLRFGEAMHLFGPGQRFVVGLEYARVDHVTVSANRHRHRIGRVHDHRIGHAARPKWQAPEDSRVWSCVIVGVPDQASNWWM